MISAVTLYSECHICTSGHRRARAVLQEFQAVPWTIIDLGDTDLLDESTALAALRLTTSMRLEEALCDVWLRRSRQCRVLKCRYVLDKLKWAGDGIARAKVTSRSGVPTRRSEGTAGDEVVVCERCSNMYVQATMNVNDIKRAILLRLIACEAMNSVEKNVWKKRSLATGGSQYPASFVHMRELL
jgi:hypothetical protein